MPLRSRAAKAALVAGLVLASAELMGWLAFWAATGRRHSYAAPQGPQLLPGTARPATVDLSSPPSPSFPITTEMLHPFLGFVQNPGLRRVPHGKGWRERSPISEHGFFDFDPSVPGPDPVTVAVLGGSMAVLLVQHAGDEIVRGLASDPRFRGRPVELVNWANPGYKQPQQLLTLAYMAALGERPQVVINLDGYNDLVLGHAENLASGVYPFYPRGWRWRVEGLPDLEAQRRLGEAGFWRGLADGGRRRIAASLAGRSAAVRLLWLAAERGIEERAALAEAAARHPPPAKGMHDYQAAGPPFIVQGNEDYLAASTGLWSRSAWELHVLCRGLGISYHQFLQPNQYDRGSKPMGRRERLQALRHEAGRGRLIESGYPMLAAAGGDLRARGVSFTDLRRVFADVEEPLYVDSCCHVSPHGSRLLARAITDAVRQGLAAGAPSPPPR